MEHSHGDRADDACCVTDNSSGLRQTLDEMEFERGIWYAAQSDDLARVERLLLDGASADAEDAAGYRALHYAARNARYRVCETLLRHGANVDARTRCGRATPLQRAAARGRADVVRLLLQHGADANLKDADGNTALHRALVASHPDVCVLLIPRTDLTVPDGTGRSVEQLAGENCSELLPLIGTRANKGSMGKED